MDPGYLLAVDPSQGFPVQGQGVIRLYPAICQPVADFCLKGRHVQALEHPVEGGHAGCLLLAEPQKLRRSTPLVPPPLSYGV